MADQSADRLHGIEALVHRAMAEWHVPGLAIAVVHDDEPILLQAFGQRGKAAGLPVTTETLFPICSLTKSFTATGLSILADAGRLDWDAPVRDHVPELRLHDRDATGRVTVRDLMLHRTGLPRHDWVHMSGQLDRAGQVAVLRHLEPAAGLRSRWQYQNLMYNLAGVVTERISGLAWEDFIQANVLDALGMDRCAFSLTRMQEDRDHARPHVPFDSGCREVPVRPIYTIPSGGMAASIGAMARYLRFHLGEGSFEGRQVVSRAAVQLMHAPQIYVGASPTKELGQVHYGFGFDVLRYKGDARVSHGGAWTGYCSSMVMLPERGMGVVVLSNGHDHPVCNLLANTVFDRLLGLDGIDWFGRLAGARDRDAAEQRRDRAGWVADRKPGTAPSHSLEDYAGDYAHPAYGTVCVTLVEGRLNWLGVGVASKLTHWHFDVFMTDADAAMWIEGWAVMFGYDSRGVIDRLMVRLEPALPDVVFMRVTPAG